jgi:BMFP domain-containing protein YqiC
MSNRERIQELEDKIAALEARLPKHSVPPAMIIELEDLEEELEMLKARANDESN